VRSFFQVESLEDGIDDAGTFSTLTKHTIGRGDPLDFQEAALDLAKFLPQGLRKTKEGQQFGGVAFQSTHHRPVLPAPLRGCEDALQFLGVP